jgi:hypothetical protein
MKQLLLLSTPSSQLSIFVKYNLIKNLSEKSKNKINDYCEQMGNKLPLIFVNSTSHTINLPSSYHICDDISSTLYFEGTVKITIEVTNFIQTILTNSALNVFQIAGKYPKVLLKFQIYIHF